MDKRSTPSALSADDRIGTRIVQAAAESIMEFGFGGATTETIARAARTSKRSLYQRFPDKQALFENVMVYLCSRAPEAAPDTQPTDDLESDLRRHALAVLDRFTDPQTRAIFIAAVGAARQYPEALEIFWTNGPGQAIQAIAKSLSRAKRKGSIGDVKPGFTARRFMMNCCGPIVLEQLIDSRASWSRRALEVHVDTVIRTLLQEI